ncbi:MAG TPA: hypothetical protein VGU69_08980 [Rhizomicrobium sp.]|nr:hypothetical protein [Rhizomicrobium sp.]
MKRGTLARAEIYLGLLIFAAVIAIAGYALVSTFADRVDPKVRDCVARNLRVESGHKPMSKDVAVALCKRLETDGAL